MDDLVLVVMGVSGAGKSTIAERVAARLGWDFAEGDQMHPPGNVAKMAAGHPLTDADRVPWLARVAAWIDEHLAAGHSGVITCSALRRSYRDVLRRPGVLFVYLAGTREQLAARVSGRPGHFMPATLLDSQFATLEVPGPDENAIRVDVARPPEQIVEEIATLTRARGRTAGSVAARNLPRPATSGVTVTDSATQGIKTVLHPVSDLATAKAVYTALLGVPPQTDGPYYVGFEAAGQHIGLVPGGGPQAMTAPVAYWHVADLAAKLAEVTAAGATVKEAPRDVGGGRLVATVTDPDGNVLGLLQDP